MKQLIVAALLAVLLSVAAAEEHHKKCCTTCKTNYPHAHHLKHSCLRGCRLYSMIYLAHDKSLPEAEISGMCAKSCHNGFSGMMGGADGGKACQTGCKEQERVFKEHGLDSHGAKLSVMHGVGAPPQMHSVVPFHHRIFQQMRAIHQRMMKAMSGAKHAFVQRIQIRIHALPPGPDGKPRYQVEIHQQRVPIIFSRPGGKPPVEPKHPANKHLLGGDGHDMQPHHPPAGHDEHHGHNHEHHHKHGHHMHDHHQMRGDHREHKTVMLRLRHYFGSMSTTAKDALRWSLFGLLVVSVLCLGWLCCRACRRASANANSAAGQMGRHQPLSLTKAFIKKKPCVQSGDIFYVDVNDKRPLMEDDAVDKKHKEEDA